MDNLKIQTTQNVDIEYQPASVGDRILATLLDYAFFVAYFLIIGVFSTMTNGLLFQSIAVIVLIGLPVLLYDLLMEIFFQGRSFGKMIMKIKVISIDGARAGIGAYIIRWLLRIIDTVLFTQAVALFAVVINGKGQRIGDIAAGTAVVKISSNVHISSTILNKIAPDYKLVYPQVSLLSDNDVAIIKEVMRLCIRTNNTMAVAKLAGKVKEVMGISAAEPDVQFLATVVQDYTAYGFDR